MNVTALIAATAPLADDPDRLQALAPVAGQRVLERQVAALVAAGVARIRVAVAAMPPELVQVLERLVRRGIDIQPVRSAGELLASLAPMPSDDGTDIAQPGLATDTPPGAGHALVIVADGLVVQDAHYRLIATASDAAILVTPDTPMTAHLERIDAAARWAGLARVPDMAVRQLADMPGEWDMVLTLLRFTVQAEAVRFSCDAALFGQGDMAVVSDDGAAARLGQRRLHRAGDTASGMGRALLFLPLVRLAGGALVARPDLVRQLPWAASAAWLVVGGALLLGWPWAALGGGLAALTMMAAGAYLLSFQTAPASAQRVQRLPGALAALLVALVPWLLAWQTAGIGALPVLADAALGLGAAMMVGLADRMQRRFGAGHRAAWLLPDLDQLWVLLLPALLAGLAELALGLVLLAGLGQMLLWVRMAAPAPDSDGPGVR